MTPWPSWYQPPGMFSPVLAHIINATAAHFGIDKASLCGPSRKRAYAWPRQLAMYIARESTIKSLTLIANAVGVTDHSTVIHGARAAAHRVKINNEWAEHDRAIRKLAGVLR